MSDKRFPATRRARVVRRGKGLCMHACEFSAGPLQSPLLQRLLGVADRRGRLLQRQTPQGGGKSLSVCRRSSKGGFGGGCCWSCVWKNATSEPPSGGQRRCQFAFSFQRQRRREEDAPRERRGFPLREGTFSASLFSHASRPSPASPSPSASALPRNAAGGSSARPSRETQFRGHLGAVSPAA